MAESTPHEGSNTQRGWFRKPPAALQPLVIVLANSIPVAGVYFFDWEVFTILFLFWLENVVVGFFNLLKMGRTPPSLHRRGEPTRDGDRFFFTLHYGFFMLGHGVFIVAMFLKPESLLDFLEALSGRWLTLLAALASLTAEHAYAYRFDFLANREYDKPSRVPQFMKPYGRLVVMHVTIIFGGVGIEELGSPRPALVLLVALKTAFDLAAWVIRLPSDGALGLFKAACGRSAIAALIGFMISSPFVGFGAAGVGLVTYWVTRLFADRPVGGTYWGVYGFAACGCIAVVSAAAAWWNHILESREGYRELSTGSKSAVIAAILVVLTAASAWPAYWGYGLVRQEIAALRAEQQRGPAATARPPSGKHSR